MSSGRRRGCNKNQLLEYLIVLFQLSQCLLININPYKFQGEPFHMLLVIFTGSLLPYLQCLDSWIYDGILDDPCEEVLKKQFLSFLFQIYISQAFILWYQKSYKSSLSYLIGLNILNSTVNHQSFMIMLCALKSSTKVYM